MAPPGDLNALPAGVLVNMGDYATTATMDTFTASRNDRRPTELAALRGA
jgi:putative DNA primase/helicase